MRVGTRQTEEDADFYLDSPKVLIFNENIEELALYAEPFEAQGFEVYKCGSVESAMRCVEREDFSLALVDQGTSEFEGHPVIRHLVRYSFPVRIILLGRGNGVECLQQASELGAAEWLEKPVSISKINRIIRDFLGNSVREPSGEGGSGDTGPPAN